MKNFIVNTGVRFSRFLSSRGTRITIIVLTVIFTTLTVLLLAFLTTKFTFRGSFEGLYLLKGSKGAIFELTDDILLGEYERMLSKVEFEGLFSPPEDPDKMHINESVLKYTWHDVSGSGYLMNQFPDGSKFLIAFGRFIDSQGKIPSGLFVGGGMPYSKYEKEQIIQSETGLAFFNNKEWLHLWCNANESMASVFSPGKTTYPSQWKFLNSRVLFDHNGELLLKSSHEIDLDGALFRMDRFAFYRAGDKFFTLVIRITNTGKTPSGYYYVYGDEPWVGQFGSSEGNVGWTKDRLYYYESSVDTKKYSYAGIFDGGNVAVPNQEYVLYSNAANFIEWLGDVRPDLVYFSNKIGLFADEKRKILLDSPNNRVMMLQWGPRILPPNASESIILAIGMAEKDPRTGIPVKPALQLDKDYIDYIISHRDVNKKSWFYSPR